MLLLTAAPGVQEWDKLTQELEDQISSDCIREFVDESCYTETYVWARPAPGMDATRVEHWTDNGDRAGRHEVAEWMHEKIGHYGTELVGDVLGSGNFSVVFDCPWDETKCIKIGHGGISSIGDIYEDGWLEYALYTMKRTREGMQNPLLPDVHKLYVSCNEDWFVALIEKYDGTFDSGDVDDDMKLKMRTARAVLSQGRYSAPNNPDEEYTRYAKQLVDDGLFPRCQDMHEGNFMYTEDGRVICTDPSSDNTQPHHEIARLLRQIGVLMPDPYADAEAEARIKRKQHEEIRNNNQRRMNAKEVRIPILLVCSKGVARFDDLPPHVNMAMEAMAKMVVWQPIWDKQGNRAKNMEDFRCWIAIDPAKPIDIRKVA